MSWTASDVEKLERYVEWQNHHLRKVLEPLAAWCVAQLIAAAERAEEKERRRKEDKEREMQRLLEGSAAFGLQWFAPMVRNLVELIAPNGANERAGEAVDEARMLAQELTHFKHTHDEIEPRHYYHYRRFFFWCCLSRIVEATWEAAVDLHRRFFNPPPAPLPPVEPISAYLPNALHSVLSQYDEPIRPYEVEEQLDAISSLVVSSFHLIPWALRARLNHTLGLPQPWRQSPTDFSKPERPDHALKRRTNRVAIRSNQRACSDVYWAARSWSVEG
ncbi:hypothetical protein BCR35DRAFT_353328 [Leucosporidium creatinivorum]|uniref:Uncharacterized protein n=1 Tax=Leucosporidium creatinivorum TaxID=106004 RepID=A0A1Y2F0L9_9BASI|nr:hypothetical protein BCR35DRAFT_353328 [Leucosporidium creatinivorum]